MLFTMDVPYVPVLDPPAAILQAAAGSAPATNPAVTSPTLPAKQNDIVFNGCRDADNPAVDYPNALVPLPAVLEYLGYRTDPKLGGDYNVPPDVLANIRTSVLETPKQGKLTLLSTQYHVYGYEAKPGYLGDDHVTFLIEAGGKRFRFGITLIVSPPKDHKTPSQCEERGLRPKQPLHQEGPEPPIQPEGSGSSTTPISGFVQANLTFSDLAGSALGETQGNTITLDVNAAAQALLGEIAPRLATTQGDLTMFVMDVPPDVPPQYAPIVVAEAAQAKDPARTDRTLGVCHLIDNRPEQRLSAINSLGPVGEAWAYFKKLEGNIKLEEADYYAAKMTLLQAPEYGELRLHESTQSGRYYPSNSNYVGPDRATVLVEIGGYKVKVLYFFNVLPSVGGSGDYKPHDDVQFCPQGKGRVWKISLNPDDPNAPIYTFEHPSQLTSTLAGIVQANLTFADLAGSALGETQGNTITLDTNAAGHGWFLDTTLWDNSEYVATSNPNEWVARQGSEAAGKMDLLTVLLHEYGHVLGLNHNENSHSLMSEDLQPGVRHTVSVEDLQALWGYLGNSVSTNPNSPNSPFNPLPLSSSLLYRNTPPNASEVALLNRVTGQSVVGTGSLSHTDSLWGGL